MRSRGKAHLAVLLLAAILGGCTTPPPGPDGRVNVDPHERVNRGIFRFNLGVDDYVLRPVSKGWTFITNDEIRLAMSRFFRHLAFPDRLLSNLGQAELGGAGTEVARFVVNTVVGVLGLFDPATGVGLLDTDQDVGLMLARWGTPSGPYWMLPIMGPANPRDTAGLLFDTVLDGTILIPGGGITRIVNGRALAAEELDLARERALDYYVFVRDAYNQAREAQIRGEEEPRSLLEGEASDDPYGLPTEFDYEDPNANP